MSNNPQFPPFIWSVTRQSDFEGCLRKYYYRHYAWRPACLSSPEERRAVYFWKVRNTIPLWTGNIIHKAVARCLHDWDPEEVISMAERDIDRDWRYSLARGQHLRDRGVDSFKEPDVILLMEHVQADYPDVLSEVKLKVEEAVRGFLDLDLLAEFRKSKEKHRLSKAESPTDEFDISKFILRDPETGKELTTWPKLDCVYEIRPSLFVIYDWKTGRVPREQDRTQLTEQLLVYSLCMYEEVQQRSLDGGFRIEAYEMYLPSGIAKGGPVNLGDLEDARDKIFKKSGAMLKVHERIKDSGIASCPASPSAQACSQCQFKYICQEACTETP